MPPAPYNRSLSSSCCSGRLWVLLFQFTTYLHSNPNHWNYRIINPLHSCLEMLEMSPVAFSVCEIMVTWLGVAFCWVPYFSFNSLLKLWGFQQVAHSSSKTLSWWLNSDIFLTPDCMYYCVLTLRFMVSLGAWSFTGVDRWGVKWGSFTCQCLDFSYFLYGVCFFLSFVLFLVLFFVWIPLQNTSVASPTSRMPIPLSAKSRQSPGTTDKAGKQQKLQDAQRQFRQVVLL